MRSRHEVLDLLRSLPGAEVASDDEVLHYIDAHQLRGRGIGYVDAHLIASAALSGGLRLWTRDRRLAEVAKERGLAHKPSA